MAADTQKLYFSFLFTMFYSFFDENMPDDDELTRRYLALDIHNVYIFYLGLVSVNSQITDYSHLGANTQFFSQP